MDLYNDNEVMDLLSHPNNKAKVSILGSGNSGLQGKTKASEVKPKTLEEKANIGVLAALIGNKETIALTGVNGSQVSNYKHGKSDDGSKKNEDLESELSKRLDPIRNRVLDRVDLFIEALTADKVLKMKGKDIAASAKSMGDLFTKLGPLGGLKGGGNSVTVQFFTPKPKEISDYPVIEVEAS